MNEIFMNETFNEFATDKYGKLITIDMHHVAGLKDFMHYKASQPPKAAPTHSHPNIVEIYCMIKGQRYSYILDNNSLNSYTYTGNEIFITFPYETHGNVNQLQSACEYYALQVKVDNPSNMLGLSPEYSQALCNILLNLPNRHLKLGDTHIHYLRTAFNFFSSLTPADIQIGVQFLTCFLFSLKYATAIHNSNDQIVSKEIEKALVYLEKNITSPIQIADLALISGYSVSHFKAKFKIELGITPAEFINLKKIDYAKKMLLETNMSITELSYELGFSSSNYFCSVFKKYLNISPSEYRKYHRNPKK